MSSEIKARPMYARAFLCLAAFVILSVNVAAQDRTEIQWQDGPTIGDLGGMATISVPKGYRFAGKAGALRVLEITQNPAEGNELGVVIPVTKNDNDFWYAIFEFDDTGYVDDNDRGNLDPDAILGSLQKNTDEANRSRQQRGWPSFFITGWEQRPFYNQSTNNLTWAVEGYSNDPKGGRDDSVNYSVRILGRRGAMSADLVVSPNQTQAVIPQFESLLSGFSFVPGQRYAEFRAGDKVAKYGLTGLILGGAVVAAAKTGLLAKFWKLLIFLFAALLAWIKKMLRFLKRLLQGKASEEQPAGQG